MTQHIIYARDGHRFSTNRLSSQAFKELEDAVIAPEHGKVLKVSLGGTGVRDRILTIKASDIIAIAEELS